MSANLRTVKNDVIHPFSIATSNVWSQISYRHDNAEPWRNALDRPFIVLPNTLQDVRHDALHELQIEVDLNSVNSDSVPLSNIELLVVARDNFSKNIIKVFQDTLDNGPDFAVSINRHALEATSLVRRVDIEVMLVTTVPVTIDGRRIRRSARLAKHVISVSTESEGLSFNFRRTSSDDFIARGLPKSTTFHLDLADRDDLLSSCDDVSSVMRVLVHEDAWLTLQEIKAGNVLGEALGTMFGADLLFTVLASVSPGDVLRIEESSIIHRVLAWLAHSGGATVDELKELLDSHDGLGILQARLQEALRITRALKRVHLSED